MASTKVEIRDNRELRRVEALAEDGQVAGFAEYQISVDGDTFDFDHTEVDERFEGEGIGSQLAAGVMEFVRAEGGRIIPTCSFLRSWMEDHEDTQDLLAEDASRDEDETEAPQDETAGHVDETQAPQQESEGDEDETEGHEDDEDSPEAGPADAKAAGAGGAAEETNEREGSA